jgi:tetratricopeptide (TPR) repeat protein
MTNERGGAATRGGRRAYAARTGRLLLLVPEAPLLLVSLAGFVATGGGPLPAAVAAVVAASFGVRVVALLLAQRLLAAAGERDALAFVRVALAMHPWSADALALRGALAVAAGELPVAETLFRRSLALLPGRAAVHAALSGVLLERGESAEAACEARRALDIDSNCAAAHLHLAQAELLAGLPSAVIEDRLRAGLVAAHDPETETTLRCALAWHLMGQDRRAEARLATTGIEATLPLCTVAYRERLRLRLCELLVAQGQTERARELLWGVAG